MSWLEIFNKKYLSKKLSTNFEVIPCTHIYQVRMRINPRLVHPKNHYQQIISSLQVFYFLDTPESGPTLSALICKSIADDSRASNGFINNLSSPKICRRGTRKLDPFHTPPPISYNYSAPPCHTQKLCLLLLPTNSVTFVLHFQKFTTL